MSTPDTQMNQYLTTIAEAVHGRDMRAAIHDGMEKTYNDSYTWFNQSLGNANQALQKATEALEIAEPMGDDIQEVKDLAEDLDTRYDETNERVNNIIAHNQDTQGNSELIDLRTTYDGQIKTSAGTAVRSQISNLHSRINNLVREQSTGELDDCHAKPVYVPLYENQYPSSAFAAQTLQLSLPGSPAPSLVKYAFIKITFKDSNLFGAGVRSVYIPNPGKDAEATNIYTSDGHVTMPADGTYGLSSYARKFTAALSSNDTVLNIMFTDCEKIATDNPFAIEDSDMTISDPSSTATTDNNYLIPYKITLIDYVLDGEVEVDKDTELIDIRNADDGTTYQSAGAAVRGQVTSAKNKTANTQSMIAPLYSVSGTYAKGDYVNYGDKLYKAKQAISSEAWTASHWQEVNVMDEVDSDVGELKSALDNITELIDDAQTVTPSNLVDDGYINQTYGSIVSDNNSFYDSEYYEVVDGETIEATNNGNPAKFATVAAYNDSKQIISASGASQIFKYTVPSGVSYVRLSFNKAYKTNLSYTLTIPNGKRVLKTNTTLSNKHEAADAKATGDAISAVASDLSYLADTVSADKTTLSSIYNVKITHTHDNATDTQVDSGLTSGVMTIYGSVTASNSRAYTQKISVQEGDVVKWFAIINGVSVQEQMDVVCAYNDASAVAASGKTSVNSYTVPSGIDGVIVTILTTLNATSNIIRIERGAETLLYKYYALNGEIGCFNTRKDSFSNETVTLPISNTGHNVLIALSGKVTAFNKLTLSVDTASTNNPLIEITTSAVHIKTYNDEITLSHGLTIQSDFRIKIKTDYEKITEFKIYSKSVSYDVISNANNDIVFNPIYGALQFTADASTTMTDISIGEALTNIESDIWVFGDSYISVSPLRWFYYLVNDGTNVFDDGYPGCNSVNALASLESLLNIHRPKMLLWLLGMNDPDIGNNVSITWKYCYDRVLELCDEMGIELVLATIPNVSYSNGTLQYNNSYKNAIVKASGKRYVDQYAALGSNASGVWIDGYYQDATNNRVHTNEAGAIALYNRFIADVPELIIP